MWRNVLLYLSEVNVLLCLSEVNIKFVWIFTHWALLHWFAHVPIEFQPKLFNKWLVDGVAKTTEEKGVKANFSLLTGWPWSDDLSCSVVRGVPPWQTSGALNMILYNAISLFSYSYSSKLKKLFSKVFHKLSYFLLTSFVPLGLFYIHTFIYSFFLISFLYVASFLFNFILAIKYLELFIVPWGETIIFHK